jgi:hypothetical protein
MERVQSLIHKIKNQYESGATSNELLQTLELMRNELMRQHEPIDHTPHSVSVMLPPGYKSPVKSTLATVSPMAEVPVSSETRKEEVDLKNKVDEIAPVAISHAIEESLVGTIPQAIIEQVPESDPVKEVTIERTAPKPPAFPFLEVPEEMETPTEEERLQESQMPIEIIDLGRIKMEEKPERKNNPAPMLWDTASELDLEAEAEDPFVFELTIEEEEDENPSPAPAATPARKPNAFIPEGFLNMGSAKPQFEPEVAELMPKVRIAEPEDVARKPRDLNELLAGRVVAKNEPTLKVAVSRALAETLGGTKISDLRKAIAINDRFRFIHSLFRNDEVAFERAVKTINNFSVLQEAQYWIQRELVIKLGWNDEDELVQQFYHLVSRRFI